MQYAQIVKGKVQGIFEYDPLPEFAPNIVMVSVQGVTPEPKAGWWYDGQDFTAPAPPPAPDYGTKISRLALKLRMTVDERKGIRAAAESNADVFDFMDLLSDSTYIDLTRAETVGGVNSLETAGLLGPGRADEILTDAVTKEEQWNG
jgi:hypothetical protein